MSALKELETGVPGLDILITFTPTLVKRSPGPRTFILDHMSNPDLLLEMLEG